MDEIDDTTRRIGALAGQIRDACHCPNQGCRVRLRQLARQLMILTIPVETQEHP